MTASRDYDVVVVGAGPVGLVAALLLAKQGISVLLLEKERSMFPLPRAAHIDHEIMRIFQSINVAEEVASSSEVSTRYEFLNVSGDVLMRFDTGRAHALSGWPPSNMIHQPSIEQILNCWVKNDAAIYSYSVNADKPVNYKTSELAPHREFPRQYLRNPPETDYYKELSNYIKENGFPEPITLMLGQNGIIKISEGNHRHEIALDLGIEIMPVKFEFKEKVKKPSEQELDNLYGQKENEPREEVPEKYIKPDPPKPVSPEKQKKINDLMDLLFKKDN